MAAFVAAIDDGSLAAAARRLGYFPAAVARAVTSLVDRGGKQLLHRTTRTSPLTLFGESYLAMYRLVLRERVTTARGAQRAAIAGHGIQSQAYHPRLYARGSRSGRKSWRTPDGGSTTRRGASHASCARLQKQVDSKVVKLEVLRVHSANLRDEFLIQRRDLDALVSLPRPVLIRNFFQPKRQT
jgi:hypothetical protein